MQKANQWYVITGAPCSGKTSVICEIEQRGYLTVPEVARAVIEEKLAEGLSLAQIKKDELAFERYILHQKIAAESLLPPQQIVFFDRGIPDSIAYFKLAGLDPSEPLASSRQTRYKKIFLLERLPFKKDQVRVEDDVMAEKLEKLIAESYSALGHTVTRIPVSSVMERTETILKAIQTD